MFASATHPNVEAFTADKTGKNLPAEYAPWRRISEGQTMPVGENNPVATAVERDGFVLVSAIDHPESDRRRCG